jgi:hypothetical protein
MVHVKVAPMGFVLVFLGKRKFRNKKMKSILFYQVFSHPVFFFFLFFFNGKPTKCRATLAVA